MGLFSGKFLLRILVGLSLLLLAAACRQNAPSEDDDFELQTPGAGATGQIDAGAVVEHLKTANLPIGRVDVYNAETDPVSRLGRPGQYVGKAIFQDSRLPLVLQDGQDVISFQNSGGIVEIFASTADLENRKKALDLARQQFPAAFPEYQYNNGVVLLRLGHVLTPEQAAGYEAAVSSFEG
ncbi:hypothetical protein BH23ACT12_BH23ACT12_02890 [soil metagenome]